MFELLRVLRDRLRALVGRNAVVDEIHEEIQFHLAERAAEHERLGVDPHTARRVARQRFGNPSVIQDRAYDVRGGGYMESVIQDAKFAVRLLVKQPGFSLVALLTLALGIGATTAIFCVVDAALIRPLPYSHPEQLVRIGLVDLSKPQTTFAPSLVDMDDWRAKTHLFSHVATSRSESVILLEGDPERVSVAFVTADYNAMYGRTPLLGRDFTVDDERLEAPPVVILGYRYWQSRFSGDPAIVGRQIRFATDTATVIGVLKDDQSRVQGRLWRPLRATPARRAARQYAAWARLKDGVTAAQAERELSQLAASLQKERVANKDIGATRITYEYDNATRSYRTTLNILVGAVGFVLLIACVNVASIQLARGRTRETELAIRRSLGAGRSRLIRQLLTENVILALAGAALGTVVALLTIDSLVANIPIALSSAVVVGVNPLVLAFTTGVAVVAGVSCGLLPALKLSRAGISPVLAQHARGARAALSRSAGRLLVALEIACAVLLVTGAALMIRSFERLSAVDLGFDPRGILTVEAAPVDPSPQSHLAYYEDLIARLRRLPGVAAVGATNSLPLGGGFRAGLVATGRNPAKRGVALQEVLPGYFEAMQLPLRAGRFVTAADVSASQPWVVLSARAATDLFPDMPAVGEQVQYGNDWLTVIGVVGDVLHNGAKMPLNAEMYISYAAQNAFTLTAQQIGEPLVIVVRPTGPVETVAPAVRDAARADGSAAVVRRVRPGQEWWSETVVTERQRTVLLGLLGGLGLLLALVGVFGVTSFAVARRTTEIGVRMAFGAQPASVVLGMITEALLPIGAGIVLGLTAATLLTGVLESFLYHTGPRDPVSFAAVAVLLALSGIVAAWLPARRAARVDPVVALRGD